MVANQYPLNLAPTQAGREKTLDRPIAPSFASPTSCPDVVNRATFGVIQLVDAVRGEFWHRGAIEIEASFDEFSLDVDLAYDGDVLEFPEQRPSNKEIRESEDGARLMAGFMLRKCADRLRSKCKDARVNVHMHYDH